MQGYVDCRRLVVFSIPYLHSFRRIFAVLAGVDRYQCAGISNLGGCVNDCKDVEGWLKANFDAQTTLLENEKATRDEILKEIKELAKNDKIEEGDPILIFLAGHGAEVKPLPGWKLLSKRNLQMFLPYDFLDHGTATSSPCSVPEYV
jgi:hypothetical protein